MEDNELSEQGQGERSRLRDEVLMLGTDMMEVGVSRKEMKISKYLMARLGEWVDEGDGKIRLRCPVASETLREVAGEYFAVNV